MGGHCSSSGEEEPHKGNNSDMLICGQAWEYRYSYIVHGGGYRYRKCELYNQKIDRTSTLENNKLPHKVELAGRKEFNDPQDTFLVYRCARSNEKR